ncbi:MAG TPA: OmpA family protein [Steroidobacteraceae bacterium]|nr:OmpA family protein [Steroidobacteraceae bacterium]
MASAAVIARQQLVWRDPPVWPFLWRGALPAAVLVLVALYALLPFAHRSIQATVEQEVRAQLAAAGLDWVGVSVAGQDVKLAGVEPAEGDGAHALSVARAASCPTWLGRHTCAVSVTGSFMPPPAPVAQEPAPAIAAAAPPAAAGPRPAPATTPSGCESSLAGLLASEQIEFASGSAKISARSSALLDRLARQVKTCPGRIRIEGYTDTVGRGRINLRLSEARAQAVRKALIARGVPPARLSAKGYGARRAIADNATEAGRARNRRIEFHTVNAK